MQARHLEKQWAGLVQAPSSLQVWDTGVDSQTLQYLGAKSVEIPENLVSIEYQIVYDISMPCHMSNSAKSVLHTLRTFLPPEST